MPACLLLPLALVLSAVAHAQCRTRLMPLGDSITEGNWGDTTYRYDLWHKLKDAGYAVDFVGTRHGTWKGWPKHSDFDQDHEGHWGWLADGVLKEIRRWTQTTRPDVALVHLGTNDIRNRQTVASTISDLEQIIDEMRRVNPKIQVVLAQLIPVSARLGFSVSALNAAIPGLANRKDTTASRVVVANQANGFDPDRDTYDGIHPNDAGYSKMANVWFAALQPLLKRCVASYRTFGRGCRGSGGTATIRAVNGSKPILGKTFVSEIVNLPSSHTPLLGFFSNNATIWGPIPLPLALEAADMPGCSLYVSGNQPIALTASSGRATWQFRIPNVHGLLGSRFYQQVAVFDPPANGSGLTMSNAGHGMLGR